VESEVEASQLVEPAAVDTTVPTIAAAAAEPAPAVAAAPALPPQPFVLPEDELSAIARSAGLEWVSSDVDKVRSVQAAMASEPRPIHVPRERKPVVLVDEGPLVLVETRKDLNQMKLPFEVAQGAQWPQA
jgi:ribonuclease E